MTGETTGRVGTYKQADLIKDIARVLLGHQARSLWEWNMRMFLHGRLFKKKILYRLDPEKRKIPPPPIQVERRGGMTELRGLIRCR